MVNCVHFASVKNSNYEFSHWDKADLCFEIDAMRLLVEVGFSDNSWSEIIASFLAGAWIRLKGSYNLYLYFSSPIWIPDTKINRHYGLWKRLSKECAIISELNVISENCHKSNSKIRFSGVAHVQSQNIKQLLPLLLSQRVGILFAIENTDKELLKKVEYTIFDQAVELPDEKMEHMVNIPKAINAIVTCSGLAIYPSGSEEFGGMYFDIFGKNEMITKLKRY